jgi:tryptophan halogenase
MNITVLGGGTAGWLTAMLTKKFYPNATVNLIESEEIGILGAGEGTVPHFIDVLKMIDISQEDLVKYAHATLKLGIRFVNWNGDGKAYHHGFNPFFQAGVHVASCDSGLHQNLAYIKTIADGVPVDTISIHERLATAKKTPFTRVETPSFMGKPAQMSIRPFAAYGLHFNARELAKFLSQRGQAQGINRIEGKVIKVLEDTNGNIKSLVLDDDSIINNDFVFDCSGFARLLIGKHLNTEWISYNKHLPLDTALPFFIPHDNKDIIPETEAIAMKYGWVWKIPVKDRYGCGYVFDSKYVSNEDAIKECEEYFGMKLESPKTFKFKAGSFAQTYVKNCMAVGLAQSFVEPLEATSIWISCLNVVDFLQHLGPTNQSETFRNKFNRECLERNERVVEFLYWHYLTKRDDSEFWRNFRSNTEMIPSIQERLDLWSETPPSAYNEPGSLLGNQSWIQVADGLKLFNDYPFKAKSSTINIDKLVGKKYETLKMAIKDYVGRAVTHDEFLEMGRKMPDAQK